MAERADVQVVLGPLLSGLYAISRAPAPVKIDYSKGMSWQFLNGSISASNFTCYILSPRDFARISF